MTSGKDANRHGTATYDWEVGYRNRYRRPVTFGGRKSDISCLMALMSTHPLLRCAA
jgi:hypothetical protein